MRRVDIKTLVVLFLVAGAFGCGTQNPTGGGDAPGLYVNESWEAGFYHFAILSEAFGRIDLLAEDVDTNWDEDGGAIYLSTDAVNEPLGTLTMTIGPIVETPGGIYEAAVLSAVLSKTDVRVGTADEINGVAWELARDPLPDLPGSGKLTTVHIGNNFITGTVDLGMKRILVRSDDLPDTAKVVGEFLAISGECTAQPPSDCR